MNINLAYFFATQAVYKDMKKMRKGTIVNMKLSWILTREAWLYHI